MLEVDLFENICNSDVLKLLQCIGIKTKVFKKNSFILKAGCSVNYLGIILEGQAAVLKKDFTGKSVLIENLKTNDIFGHDIVCCGISKSSFDVVAKEKCEILFLPFEKVVTPCEKICKCHLQLIKNVMKMIATKNSLLNEKIDVIGQKTIRDKILALLESYKTNEKVFSIPFTREEMSKFLCTDRSALSRELCKMRDDGILKFKKNTFELLK